MLTIFTHIPKTAGTSFFNQVIVPNYTDDEILSDFSLLGFPRSLRPEHKVVTGHREYGLHRLTLRHCQYVTFLRNPVDRAISAYHFILQCDPRYCKHSLYEYASSGSITDFYRNSRFQDQMSQMLAGFEYGLLRKYTRSSWFSEQMLARAKHNLAKNYLVFGIKERFEDSIQLVGNTLGLENRQSIEKRFKKTRSRPALHDLSSDIIDQITEAHLLDQELYDFAVALFDERVVSLDSRKKHRSDRSPRLLPLQ